MVAEVLLAHRVIQARPDPLATLVLLVTQALMV
jgi:hypothetical protein